MLSWAEIEAVDEERRRREASQAADQFAETTVRGGAPGAKAGARRPEVFVLPAEPLAEAADSADDETWSTADRPAEPGRRRPVPAR